MTALNHKKIIGLFLVVALFSVSLPLGNLHAQDGPPSVEEGDENIIFRQSTTQPTSASPTEASKPKLDSLYQMVSQVQCSETWFGPCITRFIAWIAFWLLVLVSAFFQVFGIVFDLATAVTLDPQTYNLEPIRIGWSIARDTANLFFIFVLLTISIATILQIETYGAKKLLPPLIIAALFINFSFLATQYVIYSSNLLTAFFLPGVTDIQSSFIGGAPSGSASKSLSVKFLAGVNPNAMFASANFGKQFEEIEKVQSRLTQVQSAIKSGYDPNDPERETSLSPEEIKGLSKEQEQLSNELKAKVNSKDFTTTTIQLGIAIAGTAVFILFATFALAFAGIALLIRVVILWFLMILSPIAFLFFVIPGLSGEAQKWWQALLKQAFFAPGFFFLFGLTVEMISSGSAQALFKAAPKIDSAFITNFTLIGYYILLIIMLLASIAFARAFGTYSGEWAYKGAKAARGYALGYAGRIAGGIGGRAIGRLSETVSTEQTRGALVRGLRWMPGGRMMAGAAIRTLEKAKKLGGLDEIRKRQLESARLLSPADRATYATGLTTTARENLMNNMSDSEIAEMYMRASQQQRPAISASIMRLGQSKQTSIQSEQFKLTPENERGQFFNNLAGPMQESFVREKLSTRDLVSLFNSGFGNIQQNMATALAQSSIERQEKFVDEFNKVALKMSDSDLVNAVSSLPDTLRTISFGAMKKEEIQKVARAHESQNRSDAFIQDVSQRSPNRTDDALSVLPRSAAAAQVPPGAPARTTGGMMPKVDFKAIDRNVANDAAFINTMFETINIKQTKDVLDRGDILTTAFRTKIRNEFARLGRTIADLVAELRRVGNTVLADQIETSQRFRQDLGI